MTPNKQALRHVYCVTANSSHSWQSTSPTVHVEEVAHNSLPLGQHFDCRLCLILSAPFLLPQPLLTVGRHDCMVITQLSSFARDLARCCGILVQELLNASDNMNSLVAGQPQDYHHVITGVSHNLRQSIVQASTSLATWYLARYSWSTGGAVPSALSWLSELARSVLELHVTIIVSYQAF